VKRKREYYVSQDKVILGKVILGDIPEVTGIKHVLVELVFPGDVE